MTTDKELMRLALEIAAEESPDPSSQNSAMLVDPETNEMLTVEVNRFPNEVDDLDERWERPQKYDFVEHAERNVIYRAAKLGIKTDGMKMIVPWFACSDCARAIISAGITHVVGIRETTTHDRWEDSINVANVMLREAGIKCEYLEPDFGMKILRAGELITL